MRFTSYVTDKKRGLRRAKKNLKLKLQSVRTIKGKKMRFATYVNGTWGTTFRREMGGATPL